MNTIAEYIWLDGAQPSPKLRSKIKVIPGDFRMREFPFLPKIEEIPVWGFDGSSTQQADGSNSDCVLKPVRIYENPLGFPKVSYLVLCEVWNTDDTPHETNTRRRLEEIISDVLRHLAILYRVSPFLTLYLFGDGIFKNFPGFNK